MTLKNRLTKLEAPVTERWRAAWDVYHELLLASVTTLLDDLDHVTKAASLEFSDDEKAEDAITALAEHLGLDGVTWLAWVYVDTPGEEDTPDYSRWPETLPEPPYEAGALEALEAYRPQGTAETFAAYALRFAVTHARMHREYIARKQ